MIIQSLLMLKALLITLSIIFMIFQHCESFSISLNLSCNKPSSISSHLKLNQHPKNKNEDNTTILSSKTLKNKKKKNRRKKKNYLDETNNTNNDSTTSITNIPIIACASAIELYRAIDMYVKPNDTVLELGSQLSDSSTLLVKKIGISSSNTTTKMGKAVLVDVKRGDAKSGRCKNYGTISTLYSSFCSNNIDQALQNDTTIVATAPKTDEDHKSIFQNQVQFIELNQFDQWRKVMYNNKQPFNVLILDIGTMIGNDLYLTALSVAYEFIAYQRSLQLPQQESFSLVDTQYPRMILIKSKSLSSFARNLVHHLRLFDGTQSIPSLTSSALSSSSSSSTDSSSFESPTIIATVGVTEYRKTIPYILQTNDEILEVGCHTGMTTNLLHQQKCKFCIGVDIGPKIIQRARERYPDVPFAVVDAWNTLDLLRVKQELISTRESHDDNDDDDDTAVFQNCNGNFFDNQVMKLISVKNGQSGLIDSNLSKMNNYDRDKTKWGYDVIYADIGGLSGADGLLESLALLNSLSKALEPRCIVIKSLCMNRLASQLQAFSAIWSKLEESKRCEISSETLL